MSRLIRISALLLASFLVACGEFIVENEEIKDNRRDLDITNDNAEELLWSAYQGFHTPFYYAQFYEYLDGSSLTVNSNPVACVGGGEYTADSYKLEGAEYEEGDTFNITFDGCVKENGVTYSGSLSGRYVGIEGYNSEFLNVVDVDQCASRVDRDEFNNGAVLITDQAENVLFDKQGARLFVRYLNPDPDNITEAVEHASYELALNEKAVVVNRSASSPSSSLEGDGASIYKVEEGVQEAIDCVFYKREIELRLDSFKIVASDSTRLIEGVVTLTHTLNSEDNKVLRVEADSLKSTIELGNLTERYTLNDFDWRMEYDEKVQGTYGAYFSAEFINDLNGAIGEVRTSSGSALRGALADLHPGSGIITVDGVGGENVAMNVNNLSSVTVAIEAEGDQTGDGRGDKTAENFDLSWVQFLNREFVRPPVLPIEPPTSGPDTDFGNLLP